ncbi:uncharacterized protein BJ171DRAFT_517381, partial [Polychytrium aggregatum]|uniref:uncharacterized protein n=1 Tax=Polychytrium aggregatum TaxID=110093 RepID=UPI0022FEB9E6
MIRLWSGFVSGSCWAQLSLQRAGLWQSAHTSFTRKRITAAISALLPTSNLDSTSSWDMCREWPRSRGPLDSIFITGLGLKEGQSRPRLSAAHSSSPRQLAPLSKDGSRVLRCSTSLMLV